MTGRSRLRASVAALAFTVAVLAFGMPGEAMAQCGTTGGVGGIFAGPGNLNNTPCPLGSSIGNANLSLNAAALDVGSQFLQKAGNVFSFRNAANDTVNPGGGGADGDPQQRYRTWFEGYGLSSRMEARDSFSGDRRHTGGGTAGVGMTVAPGVNLGMSVDQSRTDIDITGAPQSGRIDLTQFAAIASFEHGPWNLGATVVNGFGSVHSQRTDSGGIASAGYDARLWGAMAELSYYWSLPNNSRLVPKISFDWMRSHTDAFAEAGGAIPVTGSAVNATRARMLVGAEFGHSWLTDRTVMDAMVYAKLVDNFEQNFGTLQISDPTGVNLPVSLVGVRESLLGADAGAGLSAKLNETVRLYVLYDGRFRSNFTAHTGTVGAEIKF